MKKGKEPMRTFGDLMQFFGAAPDDKKPPRRAKRSRAEKRTPPAEAPRCGRNRPLAGPTEGVGRGRHAAEAAAEPAVPVEGNVVDANLGSPPATPLSPVPAESVSPTPGGSLSLAEPQTPPADPGRAAPSA